MKRISFYAGRNRSDDLLHIETDGCVVNIRVGLRDDQGRMVTRVDVLPDDETRGPDGDGYYWHQDGARIIRDEPLKPGDPIPPEQNGGQAGYVAGECGHRVAGTEWAAGFRNCERCGS